MAKVAPNKGVINDFDGSPLEIGFWHFTDLDPIEDALTTKLDDRICFLERDGTLLLVISNKNGALWNFSRGANPRNMIEVRVSISDMVTGHVTDCALKYPYAFFATKCVGEIREQQFIEIWDIEKNQPMRKIRMEDSKRSIRPGCGFDGYFDLGTLSITLNGNILASKIRRKAYFCNSKIESRIFIYDIEELVNPNISTDDLWMKTLEYQVTAEYPDYCANPITPSYYIAINSTSLFTISEYGCKEGQKQIYIWNFLNNKNGREGGSLLKWIGKGSLKKRFKSLTHKQ